MVSRKTFAKKYNTLWAIKRALPAISAKTFLAFLADVSNESNAHRATKARSLRGLIDGQFVLHITMLESIFIDHLQAKDLELASATDLVSSVVDALNEKRNGETWSEIWECVHWLALKCSSLMSPDILLGLPITEAIDIWPLECVIASLFLGAHLYDAVMNYLIIMV
ncbi:Homeodomain-interacting protein kinase 3 [Merluccius polli]|uniref:Homeodomain-interacting protein kinase 3 n=1 Tax=Merluccius polli TaxID=89951 RepID=A0AA47NZ75_MERPO|nr:Homeodomain-interacting protein kinase 3 [Merluccius polli]